MARTGQQSVSGLWTAPNPNLAPPGALQTANDAIIRANGIVEKRRPMAFSKDLVGASLDVGLYGCLGGIVALDAYPSVGIYGYYYLSGGAWAEYTTAAHRVFAASASNPTPSIFSLGGMGIDAMGWASEGSAGAHQRIWNGSKILTLGGAVTPLGVPPALDATATITVTGSGSLFGAFTTAQQVAYRIVWGIDYGSGFFALGPPSGRVLCNSTAANQNVSLTFSVPPWIQTLKATDGANVFVQIYRTNVTTPAAVIAASVDGDAAGDEMALVYQSYYVSGTTLTVVDFCPDTNKGSFLYTNASQAGIAQSNYKPPQAMFATEFKQRALYARTMQPARGSLQMMAVPSQWKINSITKDSPIVGQATIQLMQYPAIPVSPDLTGLTATNYVAITGTTNYNTGNVAFPIVSVNNGLSQIVIGTTPGVTESPAAGYCMVGDLTVSHGGGGTNTIHATYGTPVNPESYYHVTSGSGLSSSDTRETVKSIIASLLAATTAGAGAYSGVLGYYTSIPGSVGTGTFRLEEVYEGLGFSVIGSGNDFAGKFTPSIKTALTFSPETKTNRVYWSRRSLPESVPLGNYVDLGSWAYPILAVTKLRDSVLIWKQDGLFKLTDDGSDVPVVSIIDTTLQLKQEGSPQGFHSVVVLTNSAYALTNKGIVRVSDSGYAGSSPHGIVSMLVQDMVRKMYEDQCSYIFATASEADQLITFAVKYSNGTYGALAYSVLTDQWTGKFDYDGTLEHPWFARTEQLGSKVYRAPFTYNGAAAAYYSIYVDDTYGSATSLPGWGRGASAPAGLVEYKCSDVGKPFPADLLNVLVSSVAGWASGTIVLSISNTPDIALGLGPGTITLSDGTTRTFYRYAIQGSTGRIYPVSSWVSAGGSLYTTTLVGATASDAPSVGASACLRRAIPVTLEWAQFIAVDELLSDRFREVGVVFDDTTTALQVFVGSYTEADAPFLQNVAIPHWQETKSIDGVRLPQRNLARTAIPLVNQNARKIAIVLYSCEVHSFLVGKSITYLHDTEQMAGRAT